jgi:hypothetical protein
MCDPVTKRGVLNDFDLARLREQRGKPSEEDNTGTMPFMALDLISEEAFQGMVPHLYRHDAESFAWCLVYICICMGKEDDGQIRTINPHPLSSWFESSSACYQSKAQTRPAVLFKNIPLHKNSVRLARAFRSHWMQRFLRQRLDDDGDGGVDEGQNWDEGEGDKGAQSNKHYVELEHTESFRQVLKLVHDAQGAVPRSRGNIFRESLKYTADLYPFLTVGT